VTLQSLISLKGRTGTAAPRVATTPSAALFFTDAINGEMDGLSTLRSELGAKDSTE
jgi:hypothetical protein